MAEWSNHITVKRITKEELPDVRWLKYRLRQQDDLELKATDTHLETFALETGMENYIVYTCGSPLTLFGVSKKPMAGYGHMVWCVAREDLYSRHKKAFVALGNYILPAWKKKYPRMFNMITENNELSYHWLKAMGAKFSEPFLYKDMSWKLFFIEGSDTDVRSSRDDCPDSHAGDEPVQSAEAAV